MSEKLKVAILGAGNGGQAIAGWMASKGCDVGITDLFPEYLTPLHKLEKLELFGAVTAEGSCTIHDNPAECVRGVDIVLMVTAAPGHKRLIEKAAPALSDGQIFIVTPGYWAHLTIPTCLKNIGYTPDLIYVEMESLIYACRAVEAGKVRISYVKNEMGIGVQPKQESARVLEIMRPFYPQLKDRGNIFKVSLDNVNFPLHPSIILLNAGWAENTQGDWIFYKDGPAPGIIRIIEAIDAERIAMGKAAGLTATPLYELLKKFYTVPGQNDLLSLLKLNPAYQEIKAPPIIDYRYLTEDIPYGLVPISNLSRFLGLATPVIDSVIQLSSTLLGKDFRSSGLGLTELGLEGFSKEELSSRLGCKV